jgi:hypothetical protein
MMISGFEPQAIFDEWITGLSRYDKKMLSVMLAQVFENRWKLLRTSAPLEAAYVLGLNEKTVRKYRDEFFGNRASSKRRKGGSTRVNDEDIRLKASMWVREHAYRKGEPNMTAKSFCEWVYNDLLPNSDLAANMPRSIKLRTATRWLRCLGFRPLSHKKGTYVARRCSGPIGNNTSQK